MSLPTQRLELRIQIELLDKVDAIAERLLISRSEFIKRSITEKLRRYTPSSVPSKHGVDMLMTDQEMDELSELLRIERMRRRMSRSRKRRLRE